MSVCCFLSSTVGFHKQFRRKKCTNRCLLEIHNPEVSVLRGFGSQNHFDEQPLRTSCAWSLKRSNKMQHIIFCTLIYSFSHHLAMLHSAKSLLAYALLPSAILFLLSPSRFSLHVWFMLFSFYSAPPCTTLVILPEKHTVHHSDPTGTGNSRELQAAPPRTHPKLMMALGKLSFSCWCREATHQSRKTRAEHARGHKAIGRTRERLSTDQLSYRQIVLFHLIQPGCEVGSVSFEASGVEAKSNLVRDFHAQGA